MDGFNDNDIRKVVEADKAHVWHHLTQHKPFETGDPRIIVEGKGMRVWDATGKEHLDAVSGAVWTVIRFEEGRSFAWEATLLPGARFVADHVLMADGDGSRLTDS